MTHAEFREWLEQERKGTFEPPGFGDHNYRIHLAKIISEYDKLPDVASELQKIIDRDTGSWSSQMVLFEELKNKLKELSK